MHKIRKKKPIADWRVTGWDSFFSFIIFATTKYKAKKIYEKLVPKEFYYCTAIREPCADKYYVKGKTFLDWSIPKDRQICINTLTTAVYLPVKIVRAVL